MLRMRSGLVVIVCSVLGASIAKAETWGLIGLQWDAKYSAPYTYKEIFGTGNDTSTAFYGGEFQVATWNLPTDVQYDGTHFELAPQPANVNKYGGYFQTFCTEAMEDWYGGQQYSFGVSKVARWDNVQDPADHTKGIEKPLTDGAASLFYDWWNGAVDGYSYDYAGAVNRAASAKDVQTVLWALQGSGRFAGLSSGDQTKDALATTAQKNLYEHYLTASHGANHVYVLNLWVKGSEDQWGSRVQDQLVVLNVVPLPAAAATTFAGLGVLLIGTIIRRRRNRAE